MQNNAIFLKLKSLQGKKVNIGYKIDRKYVLFESEDTVIIKDFTTHDVVVSCISTQHELILKINQIKHLNGTEIHT
jgi:hypothetical protein